jgi:hypothetical protein
MTERTNNEASSTEQQIAQVLSLVEQLKADFKQEREALQAKIDHLEARLNEQKDYSTEVELSEKGEKTSRRKMLRKLGAAAAGIAALGVATNAMQPESAYAATMVTDANNPVSTSLTEVSGSGTGITTVLTVQHTGNQTNNDALVARAGGGVPIIGEATGQGSGVVGYQGNRASIDPALGTPSVGGKSAGVTGASLNKPGVQGLSQNQAGVRAVSISGIGVTSRAGLQGAYLASTGAYGQLVLRPGTTVGPIITNEHFLGELYLDSNYDLWVLKSGGTSLTDTDLAPEAWDQLPKPFVPLATDWRKLNGTGTGGGQELFFLATPIRIIDTQKATAPDARLTSNGTGSPAATFQTKQITGVVVSGLSVPAGAKGIFGGITSVGATIAGNLRLWPFGGAVPNVNTLNIPTRDGVPLNLTTSFMVGLSGDGRINVGYSNGSAGSTCGYQLDVAGYIL